MAATLNVPQGAVNYTGVLNALPSILREPDPTGVGDRYVPFGINWGTDGGANNAVLIDLSNGGVQPMGQIAALWVDNNGNNQDTSFLFIASQTRVTVPARSAEMVPVPTGDIRFYVVSPGAAAGDNTFGAMFNFMPPPVALAETAFTASAVPGTVVSMTAASNNQLLPLGANGVVTDVDLSCFNIVAGAAAGQIQWQLIDGSTPSAKFIAYGTITVRNGVTYDNMFGVYRMPNLNVPFHNGLVFGVNVTGTAPASGSFSVNVYTR